MVTRVAIAGANGRMGQELIAACFDAGHIEDIEIVALLVRDGSPLIGEIPRLSADNQSDVGYTSQADTLDSKIDVLVDFTLPDNTLNNIQACIDADCAIVIGTTGFSNEQQLVINNAAKQISVLQASNMSIGVNVTLALLRQAAKVLGDSAEIEITETHHIHKLDSPSGTAITMGEVIANSRGINLEDLTSNGLEIKAIREGEVIGDHQVSFKLDDEVIEINHQAGSRGIFAKGAIKAAQWLVGKEPGIYSMDDVLGI